MKKVAALIAVLFCSAALFAQGISFETGDWKSVVARARQEQKLIYVDVYTTWCGPCKILASAIFPQKEAGDKYNSLFVNYRLDAEKGEGIELAKKYAVDGFPTHLFIDPDNEEVVYRDMGTPQKVSDFNHHADVALEERKDSMTWEKYNTAFRQGKTDTAFLRAYLQKAKRLDKNNDAVLNAYVARIQPSAITPGQLDFLEEQIQTVDNNAVPIIYAHRAALDKKHPELNDYSGKILRHWEYSTLEKAVASKNETILTVLAERHHQFFPTEDSAQIYWYRTRYYTETADSDKQQGAAMQEASFLLAKSLLSYQQEDKKAQAGVRQDLHAQLVFMKVPADKLDELMKVNLARHPSIMYPSSSRAAGSLNDIAWRVYERQPADGALMKQALRWAERSSVLTQNCGDLWPSYADTYAHLLYASGDRQKAITTEASCVNKSKSMPGGNAEDIKGLEETLQKMKDGAL